jgi:hypothetical protein
MGREPNAEHAGRRVDWHEARDWRFAIAHRDALAPARSAQVFTESGFEFGHPDGSFAALRHGHKIVITSHESTGLVHSQRSDWSARDTHHNRCGSAQLTS